MVKRMSQKTFTEKEIKILNKNPYVKKVSDKNQSLTVMNLNS